MIFHTFIHRCVKFPKMVSCLKTSLILLLILHRSENKALRSRVSRTPTTTIADYYNPFELSSIETWESPEAFEPNTTLYTWSPAIPGTRINDTDYDVYPYVPRHHQDHVGILNKVQLDGINDVRYQLRPWQTGTIIMLHPAGEFGISWKVFVEVCKTEFRFRNIKVIYPSAPRRRYSLANGELRYIWFDEWDNTPYSPEKLTTFEPSFEGLDAIIQNELRHNITADRIVIGGMGMGGEMAMHMAYTKYPNLRAVFVLSSHLKNNSIVYKILAERKQAKVPYLYASYSKDSQHAKLKWSRDTFNNLKRLGVPGEFHQTPIVKLPTSIDCPVFDELQDWLERILLDLGLGGKLPRDGSLDISRMFI